MRSLIMEVVERQLKSGFKRTTFGKNPVKILKYRDLGNVN